MRLCSLDYNKATLTLLICQETPLHKMANCTSGNVLSWSIYHCYSVHQ